MTDLSMSMFLTKVDLEAARKLYDEHAANRLLFEKACQSDDISQEEYNAIRERYNASLRAYHDALGYDRPVGNAREPS